MKAISLQDVARALPRTQRAALLWLPADGTPRDWEKGAPTRTSFYCLQLWSTCGNRERQLIAAGSFVVVAPPRPAERGSGRVWAPDRYHLTPLGQRLRKILEAQIAPEKRRD